jgi:hypothetical protein
VLLILIIIIVIFLIVVLVGGTCSSYCGSDADCYNCCLICCGGSDTPTHPFAPNGVYALPSNGD